MYTFTLPIYYVQEFKRKDPVRHLVGMNWYNSAHYSLKNTVKQYFHSLVADQCWEIPLINQFTVTYTIHYKHASTDCSNVAAVIEKFFLDGLKSAHVITDDNNKYHKGSSWSVGTQDKLNPRVEITLTPIP